MSIKSQHRDDMLGLLFWFVVSSVVAGVAGGLVALASWAVVHGG